MNFARPPPELNATGPMDQNWKTWRDQFLTFLKASGAIERSADVKACLLINLMGPVGSKVLEKLCFDSPNDREDFDILLKKFDGHFLPKETETNARFIFFTSVRQQSESIKQYVNTLKVKAAACKFGELTESLIRDKIVLDVKNKTLRKHFLRESDLSLSSAVELWEKWEKEEKVRYLLCQPKPNLFISDSNEKPGLSKNQTINEKICEKCGTQHEQKKCPARGQTCENCGMLNHFGKVCTKPSIRKSVSDPTDKAESAIASKSPKKFSFFEPGPITKIPGFRKKDAYE